MWNDTDVPLAYFISFRCYGTWLHGDKRGSIDRHNNVYGTPKIPLLTVLTWGSAEAAPPEQIAASRRWLGIK